MPAVKKPQNISLKTNRLLHTSFTTNGQDYTVLGNHPVSPSAAHVQSYPGSEFEEFIYIR
ncbi:hypothetical protein D9757_012384 [Collybiopsis confluens]|uniref:Uncharacterized protein n=1 Tax=Collybiopsis confluens TaxID=2823264 RepID=A0A8H5LQU5_9AGAR|nr:hypothetical protein D9757_012384 [Collybiopsis confluens]